MIDFLILITETKCLCVKCIQFTWKWSENYNRIIMPSMKSAVAVCIVIKTEKIEFVPFNIEYSGIFASCWAEIPWQTNSRQTFHVQTNNTCHAITISNGEPDINKNKQNIYKININANHFHISRSHKNWVTLCTHLLDKQMGI